MSLVTAPANAGAVSSAINPENIVALQLLHSSLQEEIAHEAMLDAQTAALSYPEDREPYYAAIVAAANVLIASATYDAAREEVFLELEEAFREVN